MNMIRLEIIGATRIRDKLSEMKISLLIGQLFRNYTTFDTYNFR